MDEGKSKERTAKDYVFDVWRRKWPLKEIPNERKDSNEQY